MKKLRLKIVENLELNNDIDLYKLKNCKSNFKTNHINKNISLIYTLIHDHSNYESVMWDFWKQDKFSCIEQMTNLLKEISTLDKMLTWDCLEVLSYYENTYEKHHLKSHLVISDSSNFCANKNFFKIDISDEIIKLGQISADLHMDRNRANKLKNIITELNNILRLPNERQQTRNGTT